MSDRTITSLAIVLALASTVLSGCAGPAATPGPASTPVASQTVATPQEATSSVEPPAPATPGSSNLSATELARMRDQLEAMEEELNSVPLPSDDDFAGAEGELY